MYDHSQGVIWRLLDHMTDCFIALRLDVSRIPLELVRCHMYKSLGIISPGERNECLVVRYSENQIRLYPPFKKYHPSQLGLLKHRKENSLSLGDSETKVIFNSRVMNLKIQFFVDFCKKFTDFAEI